jgi:hypothetical protein
MQFFLTLSLLVLGSSLVTFRIREDIRPYRDHIGVILLVYGFGNFFLYLFGEFFALVEHHILFALLKLSLWIILMVIGFLLAYPLLERHLFSMHSDLKDQGQRVFEGFNGFRMLLGIGGLIVATLLLISQFNLI